MNMKAKMSINTLRYAGAFALLATAATWSFASTTDAEPVTREGCRQDVSTANALLPYPGSSICGLPPQNHPSVVWERKSKGQSPDTKPMGVSPAEGSNAADVPAVSLPMIERSSTAAPTPKVFNQAEYEALLKRAK